MGDRYEGIGDAHRKTFDWVFLGKEKVNVALDSTNETSESFIKMDRFPDAGEGIGEAAHEKTVETSWSSFSHWLNEDEGMYWITGKPGSGKSTPMKYLCNKRRTRQYLRHWTGIYPLVTAGFFFWNSGTAMQMSRMGLLRLFSINQSKVIQSLSLFSFLTGGDHMSYSGVISIPGPGQNLAVRSTF
jgi:hypothetical protein